ncbi:helix-turn-helix domain-containing protein [Brevibacterium sp. UMB10442]|uniref:TetR/AcrR family transcriptional regulator n=1 Tax=Brevibacterium sp. UMB1308A TaxID=3050608 RepID=UPI002551BC1B|nr:helix-turn-helix domain-containing protein [Brevibacterium sp. UMB1308A]MDK7750552.1 helix-turn-helix domain-containing protein [Brevibacterium sp. UMB10442]MDK8347280.1 helix-turn-helix domain-containing protein [Brevibacterium sp. UMB1308B]MDK8713432.1 helix-turn-helix domain-containing protein [Brevibacterium sp. UMB1308A]
MSYWEHRKPVRRLRAVDIGEVARASVRLLDEGGLRALTLRSVAQQVGVAPASLYSRVESVDDLFDLALDTALADDPVMSESIRNADLPALIHAFLSTSRPTGGPAW